jgi:predicted membrane-bound dolichyl-phosphate-mannose-protein mannosyltransferase
MHALKTGAFLDKKVTFTAAKTLVVYTLSYLLQEYSQFCYYAVPLMRTDYNAIDE